MAAATKKKLDEEHLKVLREMVALPHNKHCFDCNQRGPTYVNMTIGSFVCTSCSGLLRGLNPPHRVKSISMASFTVDEMEFIKSRGNAFCQKVWLAQHDGRLPMAVDARDEMKMRDAMAQRYERKRWYIQPTDAMYEEARKQNLPVTPVTSKSSIITSKPVMSVMDVQKSDISQMTSQSVQRPSVVSSALPAAENVISMGLAMPAAGGSTVSLSSANSTSSAKFDLLADFGGDPFAPRPVPQTDGTDSFANFASFSNTSCQPTSVPVPSFTANFPPVSTSTSVPPPVAADKYSALAELESTFGPPVPTTSIDWDGTSRSTPTWGNSASSGSVFGGGSRTTSSSGFMFSGGASATAVAAGSSAFNTGFGPVATGFPVAPAAGSNPFGQTQMSTQTAVANPFMTSTSYGQPTFGQMQPFQTGSIMYGQFGGVSSTAQVASVGPFGPPAGSMPAMNGGGMWGGFQQQPAQVAQPFAAWGQPTAPNPFMGSMPAKSSNVSNPFL